MFTMTHRLGLSVIILAGLTIVGYAYQLPTPTILAQNLPTATPYPPAAADAFRLAAMSYQIAHDDSFENVTRQVLLATESLRRLPTYEGQVALRQHLTLLPHATKPFTADLITDACSRLPRNLSHAEWRQYVGDEPYQATCANLPVPEN